MLQPMGSQRVGHNWVTEQQQTGMRRRKDCDRVPKISNYLKTPSTCLPGAQSASLSNLNYLQGLSKVSS